jgi:hypothetical protein
MRRAADSMQITAQLLSIFETGSIGSFVPLQARFAIAHFGYLESSFKLIYKDIEAANWGGL